MAKTFQFFIRFIAGTFFGAMIGSVGGLFAYAKNTDVNGLDGRFVDILMAGIILGALAGFFWARVAVKEIDKSFVPTAGLTLLNKYHQAAHIGADTQAGQYTITESYLKRLLGRR